MRTPVIWHGTQTDATDLTEAIGHNCDCKFDNAGARTTTCTAHQMMVEDQRAMDGLLYARAILSRLMDEEWCVPDNLSVRIPTGQEGQSAL